MASNPTQRDLFEAARRDALLRPTRFDPAIIDVDGSDVNVVLNVSAAQGEEVAFFNQAAINELALSTSKDEKLDRLVYDLYQLLRKSAQSAVAVLRLTRGGTAALTVPAGSSFGTGAGVNFRTLVDVTFGVGQRGPFDVRAQAEVTGVAGNVGSATIVRVVASLADTTVTVTNPEPATGGRDRETDDQFLERARQFFVTARRGTLGAIQFGGLENDRVAQATAIEVTDLATLNPAYRVILSIADVNGQANAALAEDVRNELQEFRAAGIPVLVDASVPQYVEIRVRGLQFASGANTTEILRQARESLIAVTNATPPRTTLFRNALQTRLGLIQQLIVPEGAIEEPAGDLVPTTGTVIRTTPERVTFV